MYMHNLKQIPSTVCIAIMLFMIPIAHAGELDDGISTYQDEPIAADDTALESQTNLSFTIVDAISSAKSKQQQCDGTGHFNNGQGEFNENSIVVGPGTHTGDIFNVIIEQ